MKQYLILIAAAFLFACNNPDKTPDTVPIEPQNTGGIAAPNLIQAVLISEYPHDTSAFTEGLFIHHGKLYEGTGELNKSFIQVSDIKTGRVEKKYPVKDSNIFGEGINIINNKLYQLTYQNHVAYMYDLSDLSKPVKTFPWQTEGWGMTNNGTELIISDGQAQGNLYFVNPADFKVKRIVQVVDNFGPVDSINELEYIDGFIYANVWGTTYIIKINPSNGHVVSRIETANTLSSFYSSYPIRQLDNVLNGIAYDSTAKKMYITGKNWPKLFEVRLN
ncbi:MAG: glutaminyl-peptide cyclotransferase [Chitinophagaceae bacterium]|nr:glutaminyl-peptide cyclotransferase [Chitinophagaceae bacterium]